MTKTLSKNKPKQVEIINTIPIMTNSEREEKRKQIGNDLYEIFIRIKEELNI